MIKEPVCIYINSNHSTKIMDFAKKVSLTTNYSDCNQNDYNLKVYQHYIGKLGELAVYLILREDGYNITEPDFKIYKAKHKSWDSDLKIDNLHLSIKTQDVRSAKRFGLSWTFQHIKNGRKDSSMKEDVIVIPTLYDNFCYKKIKVIVFPSKKITQIKFNDPKKESLKGKKKVMYAEDNYLNVDKWLKQFNIN